MHCPPQEVDPGPRWRRRLLRAALMTAGILAVGVAVAACGGAPSTPGGSAGSSTADGSPSADGSSGLLAYSSCMRSHGVPNFPDPASSGGIPKAAVVSAEGAVSHSQAQAAQNACEHLIAGESLSGQPIQTITAQQQQYYLKAAACMRSHGITNFPEPVFANGQVEFPMLKRVVDVHSPQFTQAFRICHKLIPSGLPYSGSGGGGGS
jgi:hypothetical protein